MPFCTKCGSKLREGAKFCSRCGQAVRTPASRSIAPRTDNTRPSTAPSRIYENTATVATSANTTTRGSISSSPQEKQTNEPALTRSPTLLTNQKANESDNNRLESQEGSKQNTGLTQNIIKSNEQASDLTNTTLLPPNTSVDTLGKEKSEILTGEQASPVLDNITGQKPIDDEEILNDPLLTSLLPNAIALSTSTARKQIDLNAQIKTKLESLKYNFKNITWNDEFNATTTFMTGSIKQLDWKLERTLQLKAILEKGSPILDFSFHLNKERPPYDWTQPFQSVELIVEEENETLEQKIRRESNVVEKISKLIGEVTVHVTENIVIMDIEANTENVRLALDAIKELAWMITITLN